MNIFLIFSLICFFSNNIYCMTKLSAQLSSLNNSLNILDTYRLSVTPIKITYAQALNNIKELKGLIDTKSLNKITDKELENKLITSKNALHEQEISTGVNAKFVVPNILDIDDLIKNLNVFDALVPSVLSHLIGATKLKLSNFTEIKSSIKNLEDLKKAIEDLNEDKIRQDVLKQGKIPFANLDLAMEFLDSFNKKPLNSIKDYEFQAYLPKLLSAFSSEFDQILQGKSEFEKLNRLKILLPKIETFRIFLDTAQPIITKKVSTKFYVSLINDFEILRKDLNYYINNLKTKLIKTTEDSVIAVDNFQMSSVNINLSAFEDKTLMLSSELYIRYVFYTKYALIHQINTILAAKEDKKLLDVINITLETVKRFKAVLPKVLAHLAKEDFEMPKDLLTDLDMKYDSLVKFKEKIEQGSQGDPKIIYEEITNLKGRLNQNETEIKAIQQELNKFPSFKQEEKLRKDLDQVAKNVRDNANQIKTKLLILIKILINNNNYKEAARLKEIMENIINLDYIRVYYNLRPEFNQYLIELEPLLALAQKKEDEELLERDKKVAQELGVKYPMYTTIKVKGFDKNILLQPYEILKLDPKSNPSIKRVANAAKDLIGIYHPDKGTTGEQKMLFNAISIIIGEAKEQLEKQIKSDQSAQQMLKEQQVAAQLGVTIPLYGTDFTTGDTILLNPYGILGIPSFGKYTEDDIYNLETKRTEELKKKENTIESSVFSEIIRIIEQAGGQIRAKIRANP